MLVEPVDDNSSYISILYKLSLIYVMVFSSLRVYVYSPEWSCTDCLLTIPNYYKHYLLDYRPYVLKKLLPKLFVKFVLYTLILYLFLSYV